jgi:hypothetical protein
MKSFDRLNRTGAFALLLALATSSCATQRNTFFGREATPPQDKQIVTFTHTPPTVPNANLQVTYSHLPLSFEANQGQTDERVDFLVHGRGYTVFLTSSEAVLALRSAERGMMNDEFKTLSSSFSTGTVLRMQLVGANLNPHVAGGEELPGKVNYFRGNDLQK